MVVMMKGDKTRHMAGSVCLGAWSASLWVTRRDQGYQTHAEASHRIGRQNHSRHMCTLTDIHVYTVDSHILTLFTPVHILIESYIDTCTHTKPRRHMHTAVITRIIQTHALHKGKPAYTLHKHSHRHTYMITHIPEGTDILSPHKSRVQYTQHIHTTSHTVHRITDWNTPHTTIMCINHT